MKIALLLWSWSGEEIRRRPDLIFFASKNSSVASQFERPSPFVRSVSSYIRFSILLASCLIILSSFLRSRKGEVRFNRASRRNGEQRNRTESKGSGKRKRDGTRNGNRERLDETKETGRKERERREKAKGGKEKTRKETRRTRTPLNFLYLRPQGKGLASSPASMLRSSISLSKVFPAARVWFDPPMVSPHSGHLACCIAPPHSPI